MNHWLFIASAYGLTLIGVVGALALGLTSMRRAEARAESVLKPR